ncbi:hypothetical protein SEPCBS119000_005502 [Sporothrix epigloea]|uniref:Autophagy-related protein 29 n=1 Tax=Sporothrix epigloea TaxID=1892477 RepID=A0ABP0DY00_9PEZI
MDLNPKHDQALDLPLRFPDDPIQAVMSPAPSSAPLPALQPNYTLFIRVPAPRNGFVDPPDVDWNKEKDDALWQVLSRASKNDINWNELSENFAAPVDFLLIQATILTERHVSQVRAQTRKVATLGSGAGTGGRDSPIPSPAFAGPGAGIGASRLMTTPTPSSAAIHRAALTGSHAGQGIRGAGAPGSGGPSGDLSPRLPMVGKNSKGRPAYPSRPSSEKVAPLSSENPASSPTSAEHRHARQQSPLPARPSRPANTRGKHSQRDGGEREGTDRRHYGQDAARETSPAALSDSSTSSTSSASSEPVVSRIFKRPPGHKMPSQKKSQRQKRGNEGGYRAIGLGISSGGSDNDKNSSDDDDDESETQAAFLRIKTPVHVAKSATYAPGGSGSSRESQHRLHQPSARLQHRRSNTGDSSSASSTTSASPTAKVFKAPTVAAATAAAAGATSASAMAAARLQSSRGPGIRSPPHLQHTLSGRSPAVLAAKAAGISREGSETGTTPSIGSSFSDLDDVSFTQSVLDEALGSKVEDTIVTQNPNSLDPLSLSATRRQR